MKCPKCGGFDLDVVDSRYTKILDGARKRRRECKKCHKRFSTYEINEDVFKNILKPNLNHERIVREQINTVRDFLAKLEAIGGKGGDSSDDLPSDPSAYWNDV